MPLTLQEVEHIADLARLELTEDEKSRYRGQLSAILDHMVQLQKLDTSAIHLQPAAQADSPLRADEPRPGLSQAALLQAAADTSRSQFKIPPVFE